jgi:hypothetical protein
MDQEFYFDDSMIKITDDSVKFGARSYPIVNITSVRMRHLQADTLRELPTFLVVAGSILMFALINLHYLFPSDWEQILQMGAITGMLLSVAGLVMLVLSFFFKSSTIYVVHLKGSFGDACPFASDDPSYTRSLVAAISRVIAERPAENSTHNQAIAESA